jgi:hypothetical protein
MRFLRHQHNDTVRTSVNNWGYDSRLTDSMLTEFDGSLRLNLTQHGKTHQVQTCLGLTD